MYLQTYNTDIQNRHYYYKCRQYRHSFIHIDNITIQTKQTFWYSYRHYYIHADNTDIIIACLVKLLIVQSLDTTFGPLERRHRLDYF